MTTVDYFMEADNVYRTKDYIVCQKVSLCRSGKGNTLIMSDDVYLLRTRKRDTDYELVYKVRGKNINGKRMRSASYIRKYID
ncbi:MAG: hypothetical protein IJA61_04680 [Clostridia bacterium]|nr:hypothetical protein [Clostridia bacterium]